MKFKSYKQQKNNTAGSDKKISIVAFIGIAILAIFGFKNIVDNYIGLGLSSVIAYVIAFAIYLLPFSFIIAELASLKVAEKSKSGLTKWIETCMGRKTSFITSYMFWFANLFYFVGALPTAMNNIAFGFTGSDYTSDSVFKIVSAFAAVVLFGILTFVSTFNTKKISKITSIGGSAILGLTIFFFTISIVAWIVGGVKGNYFVDNSQAPGLIPNDKLDWFGDSGAVNFAWMSTFIWVLMAADGAQTLGVYVKDVKGGTKGFSKGIIWAVLIIGMIYILGTLLVSVFPPKVEGAGDLANGSYLSFYNMFYFIFGDKGLKWMDATQIRVFTFVLIGLINTLVSIGGILVWTSAPVRTFFSEIPAGVFSSTLSKENRNGSPVVGAWIQFIIVAPLLLIPALGLPSLNDFFNFIKTASGWIGMIPPLIIFLSYFMLRLKKDHLERSFKMGNRIFGLIVSFLMILIFCAILVVTFLDVPLDKNPSEWDSTWWIKVLYKVGCFVLLVLPIALWYLRYEKVLFLVEKAKKYDVDPKLIFFNKAYFWGRNKKTDMFFFNKEYQEYENKRSEIIKNYNDKIQNFFSDREKEIGKLIEKQNKLLQELEFGKKVSLKMQILFKTDDVSQYEKLKAQEYKNIIKELKKELALNKNNNIKDIANKRQQLLKSTSGFYDSFNDKEFDKNSIVINNDIEINSKVIESFGAVRKGIFTTTNNILDSVTIHKDGVIFNYLINNEYSPIKFNFEDSKFLIHKSSPNKKFNTAGVEKEFTKVSMIRINQADLFYEQIYVENCKKFEELLNKHNNLFETK